MEEPFVGPPLSWSGSSSIGAGPSRLDLNILFDLSPLPLLVISPSWRITNASSRLLSVWHVPSADACVGQELLPFVQNQLSASPVHLRYLTVAIDDAIATRTERTTKSISPHSAASWRVRVIPIFKDDELVAVVTEWLEGPLTELNLAEDQIVTPGLSIDEAFRMLVQAVKDYAIFLLDTNGRIATWNAGAELLKGYTRDEIIGKHFSIFYGKEDLAAKKPEMELEICMRDGRVEDEGWRYKKDGTRFWANVTITAVYKDGVHVGFGKVTRDLTERKSAESRLVAAYEESDKLKSDFLANMSHEIRTPMHGMLSACALLLETELTERQRDIVGIMDESGQVLLQVINDILDYSKLAAGGFSIHSDIVGITSIVTSVVRSVQTTLPPSVHFELFLAPNLPRSVQGDPLRFRQILQNIVGNAAKFTEGGSIRVRASVESEDMDSYTVMTEVTDTGIGIPERAAADLFQPFTQYDATTTKQYKGTGLGLSIAKSLAELMGGRIGYRPNPERHGSVFWFTAKFKKIKSLQQIQDWKSKLVAREGTILASPDHDVVSLQKQLATVASIKHFLLVEDNVINQKVMLGMLRSLGFKNVALASNGSEAVNMVRSKPAAYDVVLMDINMPVMDGNEASRAIRKAGIRVPIIAMTAYALKGDRERCLEQGMNDYIPKPVDKKLLIRTLGKWILKMPDYRRSFGDQLNKLRHYEALNPTFSPTPDAKEDAAAFWQGSVRNSSDDTVIIAEPPASAPPMTGNEADRETPSANTTADNTADNTPTAPLTHEASVEDSIAHPTDSSAEGISVVPDPVRSQPRSIDRKVQGAPQAIEIPSNNEFSTSNHGSQTSEATDSGQGTVSSESATSSTTPFDKSVDSDDAPVNTSPAAEKNLFMLLP
ncbi:hypothetical protein QBC35DRAFT_517028 [Podospora australis]|uniref:Signal transduction histidine-protein kinase n=1 Tax=Podospora australis TaxID=1536484 RepID=A0AAN6WNJ7_9PEZI|nr:hypothetical protein QBC35DRAFT_517028 [Podospora australis]